MAATRTAGRGLSTDELSTIRDSLAAGRKPKVVFTATAGQIAGQTGQVVQLTDPDGSDEFVVVRFGRDELPFSPADLSLPGRASAKKAVKTAPPPPPPEPELKLTVPPKPVPAPREEATVPEVTETPPPVKAARKAAKPKPPAALTVTLSYGEGEWTIGATQGSKALAKPYVIKPVEALRMVALVDVPGVQEAVEHIMAAERAEAEQQAEKLRAELAEIEARLAELRDAR
jgi:hypothetical protein